MGAGLGVGKVGGAGGAWPWLPSLLLADVPASLGWDGQGTGPEGGREQDGDLAPGVCLSWFLAALSRLWLSRSLKLGAAGLAQEETPWAPALSPDLTPGVGLFRQSGPDRGAWPSDGGQRPRQGPGGGGAARGPQHDGEAGEGGEAGGRGWGSVVSAQLLREGAPALWEAEGCGVCTLGTL